MDMINLAINYMKDHIPLTIAILAAVVVLCLLFKTEGLVPLLFKAIGTVLQQICSLVVEAICLVFKIINSLEIYIVLLIDVLTGKISSDKKIASLAIGVLSIASFYTTYKGMESFVEKDAFAISFLITLGIQAILLSTSLRINDFLNLDSAEQKIFSFKKLILGTGFTCGVGCITAYLLKIIDLSYSLKKTLYHILYIVVIVSALIVIFSLIMGLIKTGMHRQNVGSFLFAIYFAVLSVSSFFSYNSFVSVMYPDHIRNIDTFQSYRLGIIALMEQADEAVDNSYYENVKAEIEYELQELERQIANLKDTDFLSADELSLYNRREEFEQYIAKKAELETFENKLTEENRIWKQEEAELFNNSGGVGPNTLAIWMEKKKLYEQRIKPITEQIERLNKEIGSTDDEIVRQVETYQKIVDTIALKRENLDCTDAITLVTILLKQEVWSISDEEFRLAVFKIEKTRENLPNGGNNTLSNNLWDMIQVYHSYITYLNQYRNIENQILNITVAQDSYTAAYTDMQAHIYTFLRSLPETKYTFSNKNGSAIQTQQLPVSNYYSTIEVLKRNANPDLNEIEKNIRTFVDNKLVGIVCALMALLIDMMILFVGIILPKDIRLHSRTTKYSEQEVRRILSNLFNKPIRR